MGYLSEVFDTMNEEQKNLLYTMVDAAKESDNYCRHDSFTIDETTKGKIAKEGLKSCINGLCTKCPYVGLIACKNYLMKDALTTIEKKF